MAKVRKIISVVMLAVLAVSLFSGCAAQKTETFRTLEDLKTATIGIVTGTSWDVVAQAEFPDAERRYFTTTADMLLALKQGKIDFFFADRPVYAGVRWDNDYITSLDDSLGSISYGLVLSKHGYDETLLAELNEFIAKSETDGTIENLAEKWYGNAEPEDHPDYTTLSGENGTLRIAIGDSMKPTAYQKGSMYTGYEVEFLTLFADEYGYKLDFQGMAFEALIPSVSTGKCDIGACGITITPERAENVTFTDPNFETYGVAVVLNESAGSSASGKTLADYATAKIGVQTGTLFEKYAKEQFPEAERHYFSLVSDMILALNQGKIDCYLSEVTYVTAAKWEGAEVEPLSEIVARSDAGFIFQKDGATAKVREELDEFIIASTENGLLEELKTKWLGDSEPSEIFDSDSLTGENGTLKVVVCPDLKPLSYIKNGEPAGYEVELLQHFAKAYGYDLEFAAVTFDAMISGVATGKYDIGAAGVTKSKERAESVDFSETYLSNDVLLVVNSAESAASAGGFLGDIKESFEKTFIREDRWKLIAEGVGVTVLISISAVIFGTLLGFGLYMLSRSDAALIRKLANGIAKVYSRIVAGTPIVVILMILFYVVFGNVRDMSGIVVAVIGFTLTFGAFVFDHMTVSVGSVDRGQTEAAYALGYTKNQTFFRIIFPQAMRIFLPSYCGQAVEVIKATAVVGYVAVNDLTKMGDIIRSNTYEAFFPLIATAVIYFLLTWVLSLLLNLVKLRFEPKRRRKEDVLKGVTPYDKN